ncbi:DNA-binding response regulator (plasmid) [Ruegeria pomeroyi DSS-3]|jgi:two-component system OmpR family response regulator|uniref:Regulatory protein VirG n=2 Tax=Ruegeria pomeroyi TaxID=89184 RepID=Q5LKM4_RUEPO|nr:response regulator [Ruegeria pomeroyi]AAV97489.1 DNA-binding response regulator [Ruegeria pomeroyi DSS-3]NVK97822.1 response regulator [Ruegeria pomeroyi]NVL02518.1 response regulator [Ruegeria pomeroyi]HCE71848.1 DNA-binding response regulator [Ruegeria sp.]
MQNATPHILVVDDHSEIRTAVCRYLEKSGLRTTMAKDAREMDAVLATENIDLVVLDVMMPGEDGLSACKRLSQSGDIPILLLTALSEDMDRIVGLETGADDYLAKPFNPRELLARIRAILRRTSRTVSPAGSLAGKRVRFAQWILDSDRRVIVDSEGRETSLTSADFKLLVVMLERARMVLSREQLMELTSGRVAAPLDRTIDNQISRLRRKIERDLLRPRLITTYRNGGYCLAADVEVLDP